MKVTVKYVTRRVNSDGAERWYWQRKGHPLVRLPDDPAARIARALRLNAEAESRLERRIGPDPHSVQAVIDRYQDSETWRGLAPKTQSSYRTWLRRYGAMWGDLDVREAITRDVIVDYLATVSKGSRRLAAAVLQVILDHAHYRGLIEVNHAQRLRIKAGKPRWQTLTDDECDAWARAAQGHPDGDRMAMAFNLLRYTGQRPSDCLAMAWPRYDGEAIQLRQEKTGRLLAVPCHTALRTLLDGRQRQHVTICEGLTYRRFNAQWRTISRAAGIIGRQARDLRRTAVVRLHEAGCEPLEIAHITGHSLSDVTGILDATYTVRTMPTARRAMGKWQNSGRTESTALDKTGDK